MKKYLLLCFVLVVGVITLSMAPDGRIVIHEDWIVSVHWYNPEIVGDYVMTIDINDPTPPFIGTVDAGSAEGLFRVKRNREVAWEFADFFAIYEGVATDRTHFVGTMYNIQGNYGDFTAVRAKGGASGDASVLLGVK